MFRQSQRFWIAAPLVIALCAPAADRAVAYTPASPEVRQTVERGVKYLESSASQDKRFGARQLAALALLKAGQPADHPIVVAAVDEIRKRLSREDPAWEDNCVYGVGLSIIFLLGLDHVRYRPEVERLLATLRRIQKPHGGWGYLNRDTGDTSMTQYPVLAMWEASHLDIHVHPEMVAGAMSWLLRTQDPSGGFGYQGRVSPDFTPVRQSTIRLSLSTAGLGSLYVCSDLTNPERSRALDDDLPPALQRKEETPGKTSQRFQLPDAAAGITRQALARGNAYLQAQYTINPPVHTYYYMYALERYWSFREKAEGVPRDAPDWYDDGVRYLIERQRDDGSWEGGAGASPDTSFAVLFLVRSTQKTIERVRDYGPGTMVGGRGLPQDTEAVIVRDGNVVSMSEAGRIEEALAAVREDGDAWSVTDLNTLAIMPAEDATPLIDQNAEVLRKLAGDPSPEARLAAVRLLARRRSMDDVPVLIYALSDPDAEIVLEARDALRRISRKFKGFGPPDVFTDPERRTAIAGWKAWFLSIRPDAEFRDY